LKEEKVQVSRGGEGLTEGDAGALGNQSLISTKKTELGVND